MRMGEVLGYEVRADVALLTVDNPPVNALTQPVREALAAGLARALDDPQVGAIVINARGRTFPAGADLRDFEHPGERPSLGQLCTLIEDAPKPVIAAVRGTALGGGFELALACHFRLLLAGAQLGLPDVMLGLVPAAGGTQRLPRIVGAGAALEMLISGRPIDAETAARVGLADRIIEKNLDKAALTTGRNIARAGVLPRPTRARTEGLADPKAYFDDIGKWRAELAKDRREAAHRAVDLVEAALLLPFEAGLAMEQDTFAQLVDSDQSHGLRHAFLAERRTTRVPQISSRTPRRIAQVGVVGGGRLGSGIVRACLAAGLPVTLLEKDEHAREAAHRRVASGLERDVERGRIAASRREAQLATLTTSAEPGQLAGVDLVIEAVTEDPQTRRSVFEMIGAATAPGTVLASAGLGSDIAALASASGRPADVIGLRFFAPAHRIPLVEVVCPAGAAPDLAATGVGFARALGKLPVLPGGGGDSLVLPMFSTLLSALAGVIAAGASAQEADAALRAYGFALGPLQIADLAGIDRLAGLDWADAGGELLSRMVQAGLLGQKTGGGFYAYDQGVQTQEPSPQSAEVLAGLRAGAPPPPRTMSPDEIVERTTLALANAGARLVGDGVAYRPSDIDAAMIAALAFPRWRGGPMEVADRHGLLQVRNSLRNLVQDGGDPALFEPAPLFDELIKNGMNFGRLNANPGLIRRRKM